MPTLNEINLARVPTWIAQNRLWATHAVLRADEAIENGQLRHARTSQSNAAYFTAKADYWANEMVGFASA